MNKKIVWSLLLAMLIASFALRFADISNLPSGLYPDEAVNGMDALNANATGQYKLFYPANNGREGLFINLQAFAVKIFGNTIPALKLWSAIFGTLTVLGVYLLAAELLRNRWAGIVAAYLTAFSYWAINFSRIGFRAIMLPFILSFAFYFLFKGLRTKKLADFIIAGFIYGLGLHTYIAFRVSPLVLIVLLVSLAITRKRFFAEYWKHILVFAIAMFIAAAPMLLDFFVWNPQDYSSRTSEISVLNPAVNQGHLALTLARTFGLALAKYNFWGDQNMRQNYPPYPLLNPITGVAFLIGFCYILFKFFHLAWLRFKKKVRDEKLDVYVFLLAWFFVLLIPEFLADEGNPHALRSIGTLPVVMIIATIPIMWIIGSVRSSYGHGFKIATLSLLIGSFVFIGLFDPLKYFVFFANNPKQHEAFEANVTEEARAIAALPAGTEKFVVAQSMQRIPIEFLDEQIPNLSYYYPGEIGQIKPKNPAAMEIFTDNNNDGILDQLQIEFPNLKLQTVSNSFGDVYYILK